MLDFDSLFSSKKSPQPSSSTRTYRIRNRQIRQQKLLSQGAFGYIFKAIDINTKQSFALKRVICSSQQRFTHAKAEMQTMSKLKESPNVVKFYGGCVEKENGNPMVVTLMELCPNGTLFNQMESREEKGFTEKELVKIVESVANGIKAIHESGFAHRDIKIQNILIGADNTYKLCDFGSCTAKQVDFSKISTTNYSDYQDQFEANTTPMYRPPQMVDPFKKFKVGKQVDVWMLGCVLYTIAYFIHPFIDASKAGISDAAFRISKEKCSDKINDFIRNMLTPNPQNRVTIDQVLEIVKVWAGYNQIPLNKQAKRIKEEFEKKEKELAIYDKKTVGYEDDIPIEVLMKLQNQLKQGVEKPLTTFKKPEPTKLAHKISAPVQVKYTAPVKPQPQPAENLFSGFEFQNIKKPTVDSWQKNDDFFTKPSVKKTQSLQFDFFTNNNPNSANNKPPNIQSKNSNPSINNNLTTQSEFYEFFGSDTVVKKNSIKSATPAQNTQFDFLL